jgi:hypothetical protein
MVERASGFGEAVAESVVSDRSSCRRVDLNDFSLDDLEQLLTREKTHNQQLPGDENLAVFFGQLDPERTTAFVVQLKRRLEKETDILDRFAKLGLDPFAADLLSLPLPFPVKICKADSSDSQALRSARAFFRDGTIHLVSELPSLNERLTNLASRGIIANDLFHEVFHGLQKGLGAYRSIADVLDVIVGADDGTACTALAEAHAWLCCLPGFRHEVLIDVIGSSYNIERDEHLRVAFNLLYSLTVLGLSDEEIGFLVGAASWSEEAGSYSELELERERRRCLAGLSKEGLEMEMQRRMLTERVQGVRAIGITRELVGAFCHEPAANSAVVA